MLWTVNMLGRSTSVPRKLNSLDAMSLLSVNPLRTPGSGRSQGAKEGPGFSSTCHPGMWEVQPAKPHIWLWNASFWKRQQLLLSFQLLLPAHFYYFIYYTYYIVMKAKFWLIFHYITFPLLAFKSSLQMNNIEHKKQKIFHFSLPPNAHNFQTCCNLIAL